MDVLAAIWLGLVREAMHPLAWALGAIALFTLFERIYPAEPGQGVAGRLLNLSHGLVFHALGFAGLALWLAFGPRFASEPRTDSGFAAVLLVVAHLLTIDFVYYGYHRAQHRFPALWAIHELHHADAELNATSSFRTYWLELPVQAIVVTTPSLWLFGDRGPVHAIGVAIGAYGFLIFSHCNLRLSLGPLSGFLCGPQVHRIHHSRLPAHRDRNFAQYFPFLDRLFGTYHPPARDEFPPTGADGLASEASIPTALIRPFRIWLGRGAPARRANEKRRQKRRG